MTEVTTSNLNCVTNTDGDIANVDVTGSRHRARNRLRCTCNGAFAAAFRCLLGDLLTILNTSYNLFAVAAIRGQRPRLRGSQVP